MPSQRPSPRKDRLDDDVLEPRNLREALELDPILSIPDPPAFKTGDNDGGKEVKEIFTRESVAPRPPSPRERRCRRRL